MKKKLLICSHAYISPENLIKPQLLAENFEVGLIVPNKWHAMGRSLSVKDWPKGQKKFQVFPARVAFSGSGGKYFYCFIQLFLAFLKFKPDILYIEEEPWTPSAFQLVLLGKLFGVEKKVLFSWENLPLPLAPWQKFIRSFVLKNVNLLIAGNSEAKQLLEKELKSANAKTPVIVNAQFGVDTKHFKPADMKQKQEGFTVGFVGRFVESKGVDTLIKSLQFLPEDTQLLLVSTTHLPEEFINLTKKLRVEKRIQVVEGSPHQDLPKYLSQMNVFVLPSKTVPTWKEQFGRVLIEAMACGLPVIGSSSGAIPEVIGSAGLIFEENSEADLAEKITSVKESKPLQKELSQKSLERVNQKYTHKKVLEGLTKALESAL